MITIEDAFKFSNFDEVILKRRDNSMLLSDYQISVLNRNGINFMDYGNIRELLFEIENCLDDYFDDELDFVGSQLSEYIYYNERTKANYFAPSSHDDGISAS